jgi:hypothetical protein
MAEARNPSRNQPPAATHQTSGTQLIKTAQRPCSNAPVAMHQRPKRETRSEQEHDNGSQHQRKQERAHAAPFPAPRTYTYIHLPHTCIHFFLSTCCQPLRCVYQHGSSWEMEMTSLHQIPAAGKHRQLPVSLPNQPRLSPAGGLRRVGRRPPP